MQSPLVQAIRALVDFLPRGKQMPMEAFNADLQQRLEEIETLSRKQSGLRDMYRKLCFDLCAYELDRCFILRRLRYKPLGYGGDFEALDKLYMGIGTTFWDAFLQHQQSVKDFREFQMEVLSPILFLSPLYRVLKDISADIALVAFEPEATQFARAFNKVEVYDSLEAIETSFALIYAPFVLHRLSSESLPDLLGYLWQKLEPDGYMVLYQLDATHHLRWFMEWCLDWVLYYHDVKTLKKLAKTLKAEAKFEVVGEWLRLELRRV